MNAPRYGRPPLHPEGSKTVAVVVPMPVYERITETAEAAGVTRSALVRDLLNEHT